MKLFLALAFFAVLSAHGASPVEYVEKECPAIKTTLAMPKDWSFLEIKGSEESGISYLVTREKVESEYDPYQMGLSLNVIKDVSAQTEMKPSEYAKSLLESSQEKDESSTIETSEEAPFKVFTSAQTIEADEGKLKVITVLKANDQTGTLYHFTWQYPEADEAQAVEIWKEITKRLKLDPAF